MALRRWLLGAVLLGACGGEDSTRFFPSDDAAAQADATTDDVTAPSDLGPASDLGTMDVPRTDVPRTDVPRTDRGGSTCPSGCATNADCLACNESPSDLYCCVSGLCVFTTGGMCAAVPEAGPINEDPNMSDGGDGAAPDTSSNPFDDVPNPGDDSGMMMPEDRPGPEMDATMDASGGTDASADVPNDLARADGAG